MLIFLIWTPITLSAPSLEDFIREPDIVGLELSPNGRYLAAVVNRGKIRKVIIKDLERSGKPIIGGFADHILCPGSIDWANNKRLLVDILVPFDRERVEKESKIKKDFDINDHFLFRRTVAIDPNGQNLMLLMENKSSSKYNTSLSRIRNFLPDDPEHVLIPAYRKDRLSLYTVNVNNDDAERIAKGNLRTFHFVSDSNGKPLYRLDYLRRIKAIKILSRIGDGQWAPVDRLYFNKQDEKALEVGGWMGLLGDKLHYRKRNKTTGFYDLVYYDMKNYEKKTIVSLKSHDIHGVLLNRAEEIVGYAVESDYTRNRYFDENAQIFYELLAKKFDNYNVN